MAILTVMVVWSECLFFIKKPVLSLFAIFLDVATTQGYNYIGIEVCPVSICQVLLVMSVVELC